MRFWQKRRQSATDFELDILGKANRVLNFVFLIMLLIVFRVWHLSIFECDKRTKDFNKPQQKIIIEHAERGTIRDRFNIPLAVNQVRYNAAVSYAQIRQISTVAWEKGKKKKKIKIYKRRKHIETLSYLLSNIIEMDADRIEDLIHAKASLLNDASFVLKEDITESQYFQLKILEKDWLGIVAERTCKRYYPHQELSGEIIGYMGAINRHEYNSFYEEKKLLEDFIHEWESGNEAKLPIGLNTIDEIRYRLRVLDKKTYTLHDRIGKTGIEATYEQELKGYHGKKIYYSDAKGNFLRELPGYQESIPGRRFVLTISQELQECAETLLIESESLREGRSIRYDPSRGTYTQYKQPWIKGGAIVVMDPNNGEILALASYPRFNPNDFVPSGNQEDMRKKSLQIKKTFEGDQFISMIWDRKHPLEREIIDPVQKKRVIEEKWLSWENYLDLILPETNRARQVFKQFAYVKDAITLQKAFNRILEVSEQNSAWYVLTTLYNDGEHIPYPSSFIPKFTKQLIEDNFKYNQIEISYLKRIIDPFLNSIPQNYDKLLFIDLCRLLVNVDTFSDELLGQVNNHFLSQYRDATCAYANINEVICNMTKELYHQYIFKNWRRDNQKEYLKQKRVEEKEKGQYAKPYIDYLDEKENALFQVFWAEYKWLFIMTFLGHDLYSEHVIREELKPFINYFLLWQKELSNGAHKAASWYKTYYNLHLCLDNLSSSLALEYLKTMREYKNLNRPLLGSYRNVSPQKPQLEKHLAASFYPNSVFGFARSYAFRQATCQGSIFKLVTAYETLLQQYHEIDSNTDSLNPLTIIDDLHPSKEGKDWNIGYTQQGKPIPQYYKGGRLPRSHRRAIGRLDFIKALEISSNPYFSILAGDMLKNPDDLIQAAKKFSFGKCTGIDLPGEYSGNLPTDLAVNQTGLYATAIGQHSLVVTPLQTAVMMSSIVNGGYVFKPKIVKFTKAEEPIRNDQMIFRKRLFDYNESFQLIGIDFPIFTATERNNRINQLCFFPDEIKNTIDFPTVIQNTLIMGMQKVVTEETGTGYWKKIRTYRQQSSPLKNYIKLQNQMIAKTSTAEKREAIDLDLNKGTNLYKHIWFGCVSYNPDHEENDIENKILKHPELVVIVYLRFGDYGREAAPIAAELIEKWRSLKEKYPEENQ